MRIVKKNVYYCDHCKKRTLSSGSMNNHEKHCTANPNRECRICLHNTGVSSNIKELVDGFKNRFNIIDAHEFDETTFSFEKVEWTGDIVTLKEIRASVENCPNCILSIIRQCKFHWECFPEECGFKEFDYKKELRNELNDWNPDYNYH